MRSVLRIAERRFLLAAAILAALLGGASGALYGVCGPFTDVAADAFCPFVQEIFYLGITTGTTATTFDPGSNVTRLQMAAFLSRTVDRTLQRANLRSTLHQFWTPQNAQAAGLVTFGAIVYSVESDGADLWVAGNNLFGNGFVFRVRASDGKLLDTWTSSIMAVPQTILVALGKVFTPASVSSAPSRLYRIDPLLPGGAVTTVASNLGDGAVGIAFDGSKIWTANGNGTVSRVDPATGFIPWAVVTSPGFVSPLGILYDGANMWVTDAGAGTLVKLNSTAGILQTVTVGTNPGFASYDGTNIWVPNGTSNSVSIVRVSNGTVLATLTGNGLNNPKGAIFDGQRVLVTNYDGGTVSLFKAADLTTLGVVNVGAGTLPYWGGSDGVNTWICNFAGVVKF